MDFRRLKAHLVVCGWKSDMEEVLLGILRANPDLDADHIVLVSNVDPERVEELKEENSLAGVKFVRGDYYSELSLQRANIRHARKALVLADSLESEAVSEVDSKTVMAVLTIKSLARDVYVTAEVLDRKFESYLRQAMCDEVLFSRELARRMLANTSATNGMSHIMYELLAQEASGSRIRTVEIPPEYVGRTFGEFRAGYGESTFRKVLGLLENTGSPGRMKLEYLREAQKTADVSRLVNNLQAVKGLQPNRPLLLPPEEHVLRGYTQAIILERPEQERSPVDGRGRSGKAPADTVI